MRTHTRRSGPVLMVGLTAVLLSACTVAHQGEQVSLCKVVEPNGWSFEKDHPLSATFVGASSSYVFNVFEKGSNDVIHGPLPRAYWITVTGTMQGPSPPTRKPMMYDPGSAVLEINGQRVQAIPRLWRSEQGNLFQPAKEVAVPANLDVEYGGTLGFFFVAFPISPPRPKDTYVFRPGSILIDGKRQTLPAFASCYVPSRTWLSPIY